MYPPPTTSVFPGFFFRENMSSEVIAYFSMFLHLESSNRVGFPPVAITHLSKEISPKKLKKMEKYLCEYFKEFYLIFLDFDKNYLLGIFIFQVFKD